MTRPPLEVADIVRTYGAEFVKQHRRWLTSLHLKVLRAIVACRTAALGGHIEQCDSCGQRAISYNSCLNGHCPKCQAAARQRWLEKRSAELLPVPYYHVVFTLPHLLAPLALQNKVLLYRLLFRAAAQTLLQIAADPKHLGADIGFLAVLHTWGQTLLAHPHLHCVVPGGGLSADHRRWIPCGPKFFLPVKVLSVVFRGKFLPVWSELLGNTSSLSLANWLLCNRPQLLPLYCAPPPIVTGSSMPSDRLPDRSKSLPIFLVILTASPSPTLASWLWSMARSPSVGATIPMATRIEP